MPIATLSRATQLLRAVSFYFIKPRDSRSDLDYDPTAGEILSELVRYSFDTLSLSTPTAAVHSGSGE